MAAAVALDKVLPHTSFFGWSRLKSERTEPKVRVTAKKATRDDGEEKGKDSSVEFNERYSSSCIITIKRVVDTILWFVSIKINSNLTLIASVLTHP